MSPILRYAEIETAKIDQLLAEHGELRVSLPPYRARLCVAFINTLRDSDTWRNLSLVRRVAAAARGFGLTLMILLRGPRLFELGRVVVLKASQEAWTVGADGHYLFRFVK